MECCGQEKARAVALSTALAVLDEFSNVVLPTPEFFGLRNGYFYLMNEVGDPGC